MLLFSGIVVPVPLGGLLVGDSFLNLPKRLGRAASSLQLARTCKNIAG